MTDKNTNPLAPTDDILLQASDWQARLWSEDVTEQDHLAFQTWRQADPLHEQAWQVLHRFNQQFEHVPKPQQHLLLQQSHHNITDWMKKGCAFCAILGIGAYLYQHNTLTIWMSDYHSKIGEIKHIELADGTQLILASNTALNFNTDTREIHLLKGQIYVETGHKFADLPALQVHSLGTTIQPLGTQFTVQQSRKNLSVAVYAGAVRIASGQLDPAITLKSGWQIRFDPAQPQPFYQETDSLQLAWLQHKLVVEQMPLCEFLAEVASYRTGHISCAGDLQQYKVSGTYSLDNTELILQQIAQTLPVRINTYSDYLVTVKAAPPP